MTFRRHKMYGMVFIGYDYVQKDSQETLNLRNNLQRILQPAEWLSRDITTCGMTFKRYYHMQNDSQEILQPAEWLSGDIKCAEWLSSDIITCKMTFKEYNNLRNDFQEISQPCKQLISIWCLFDVISMSQTSKRQWIDISCLQGTCGMTFKRYYHMRNDSQETKDVRNDSQEIS